MGVLEMKIVSWLRKREHALIEEVKEHKKNCLSINRKTYGTAYMKFKEDGRKKFSRH